MKYYGLIIPRSYNDYFSRSDPQAIQQQVRAICDSALDKTSQNPIQNKPVAEKFEDIEDLIPTQASDSNQLADKQFVNSSVGTNTANYISDNGEPFASVSALEAYSGTVTNNDYAFVTGTDSAGNTYYDRYKATVSGSSVTWAKEYRLNNSSFTAAQWAAINSGITAALVQQLQTLIEPIGIVKAYAGANTPANYLPCDGAAVSRTDYAALFDVIGTTYGAGDGSTTFNVPDYREVVLVGIGKNTTNIFDSSETDPSTQQIGTQDHDVYTLGEFKDDQIQSHRHKHNLYCDGSNGSDWSYRTGVSNYWLNEQKTGYNDGRSGTTTHGKQKGVNYIIKYQ